MSSPFRFRLFTDKRGNVAIVAAITTPFIVASLALGIDFGQLTLQQRALQANADIAAIVATSQLPEAEEALLRHFQINGQNFAIRSGGRLVTSAGSIPFDGATTFRTFDGYVELTLGQYTADPSIPVAERFVEAASAPDAVKIAIVRDAQLYFAGAFATAPRLRAVGTASTQKLAAFSIGSRLASLDAGLLNAVTGALLGTKLSLSLMDYEALIDADIDAHALVGAVATEIGVEGATYDRVLSSTITQGQFLAAVARTARFENRAGKAVETARKALIGPQKTLKLGQVIYLSPYGNKLVGSGDTLVVKASVFDLLAAGAAAANGEKQVEIDLAAQLPGLASTKMTIAIGERPVQTPALSAGMQGSIVRTAQTRIMLEARLDGLSSLSGLKVHLPLYIDIAHAEARLARISCHGGARNNASVTVEAVPGVLDIALGHVDPDAFDNFGVAARVSEASVVSSKLLEVRALGHVDIDNIRKSELTFLPSEILAGEVKSVSTRDTLTSLTGSLLADTEFRVKSLGLSIASPKGVQESVAKTLAEATAPLDMLLHNTLLALGIRIGEADVRVTGVACQRPVLVD